jgi:gliding motility-associated-like protein
MPGDEITYAFTVFNLGTVTLVNITVTDPLVTVQGGPITLAPLASDATSFTATYILTQDDINAGFVENQALVSGFTLNGDEVTDLSDDNSEFEDDPTVTDVCIGASISLEKIGVFNDENGDMDCQVGETISYTFNVINTGNVTLYNITLTDPLPRLVLEGGPIMMLEAGMTDSTTFTATYTLTEDDLDTNAEIINQALVIAQTIDGDDVTDDSDDPNDPTNTDNNGDGEPDDPTVVRLPCVGSVFEIFNGITPNGDGLNDFLLVQGIDEFPNNNIKIFNRWGVLVFEIDRYNEGSNVFRGISEGRTTIRKGEELPTGTYFYILTFSGDCPLGRCAWNGYLYINR